MANAVTIIVGRRYITEQRWECIALTKVRAKYHTLNVLWLDGPVKGHEGNIAVKDIIGEMKEGEEK